MVANMSTLPPNLIKVFKETTDVWSIVEDLCNSHKLMFDLFNMLQERVIYLEKKAGSCAVFPDCMQ